VDSSYEEVKHTLKTEGYDLIHFSSHGKHDNGMPLYSVIELEEGRKIRPESIVGMATKFGASHPIVFLNTCQSGAQGFSLTGVQSWVRKFLDSGASAFVDTLWSVSDETALKFTQELYTELSKGVTIGEAVRTARKNCKKFGDPSWLAYEFYGQPNVKIAFNDK
jgi:CHAT domain-containing protein